MLVLQEQARLATEQAGAEETLKSCACKANMRIDRQPFLRQGYIGYRTRKLEE